MFNPAHLEAMKHMTPEDMKRAGETMAKMSPEDIRRMAQMSGMGNIDPAFLSQAASMAAQMSPETLNAMKNAVPQAAPQQPPSPPPQQTPSRLDPVVQMKNKGNDFFKKGQLLDAIEQYESALQLLSSHGLSKEVVDMEVNIRTNLATTEAKRQNWPGVITQCKKVQTFDQNNYKACFRYGQALMETGDLVRAEEMMEKAKQINPSDAAVVEMLTDLRTRKAAKPQEEVKVEEVKKAEKPVEEAKAKPPVEEVKAPPPVNEPTPPPTKPDAPAEVPVLRNHKKDRGIKIEEVLEPMPKAEPARTVPPPVSAAQAPPSMPAGQFPPYGANPLDPNVIAQQKEALKNMDEGQLGAVLENMKSMDPTFLANMYKQMGMSISPEQIRMMTQCMTPEMLKNMANTSPGQMPSVPLQPAASSAAAGPQAAAMPTMPAMPAMNSAFLQETLNNPAMAQMLGGMLGKQFGRSEAEGEMVISCLKRLVNAFVTMSKIYSFFFGGQRKYVTAAVLIGWIAYSYS